MKTDTIKKCTFWFRLLLLICGVIVIFIASSPNYNTFDGEITLGFSGAVITIVKNICRAIRHILKFIGGICYKFGLPFKWGYKNTLFRTVLILVFTVFYAIYFKRLMTQREENPEHNTLDQLGPMRYFGPYVLMFILPFVFIDSYLSTKYYLFKNIYTITNAIGDIFKALASIIDFCFRIILFVLDLIKDDVSVGMLMIILAVLPTVASLLKKNIEKWIQPAQA